MKLSDIAALTDDELRVNVGESVNAMGLSVCRSCWNFVDGQFCWCGDAIESHTGYEGHSAIPMGCRCGYADQPQPHSVPDYPSDLNAMHEAEKGMHDAEDSAEWNKYVRALNRICSEAGDEDVHASARQRCIAFLAIKSP